MIENVRTAVKLILVGLLLSVSVGAKACQPEPVEEDESDCQTMRSYDYIAIKGGHNKVTWPTITSGSATALGLVIGHRFSDLFSVEFEYMSYGTYSTPAASLHATAVGLSALHIYQMSENFGIYGRLGLDYSRVTDGNIGLAGSLFFPAYALGAEYSINKDISLRLGFDAHRLNVDRTARSARSRLGGLSILYKY